MTPVEEAQAALKAALAAQEATQRASDVDLKAARDKHRQPLADAAQAVADARHAVNVAKSVTAEPHPWEGRRVVRRHSHKRILGVVETCRIATPFPANARWSRPGVGTPFVRLLRADGIPGLRFASFVNDRWELDT